MSSFVGSVGMIRHPEQGERLWLVIWDAEQGHFDFVIAEKLENDSFREALQREVAWILPLDRKRDFIISQMARLHLESVLSIGGKDPTYFIVELFVVELYGKQALENVERDDQTRWLAASEILGGKTSDGHPVSPRLVTLLQKADVLPKHAN